MPGRSEAAELAAVSMPGELQAVFAAEAALEEAYPTDAEVAGSQRRRLLLWMHRLPSYRARLHQILGSMEATRLHTVQVSRRPSRSDASPNSNSLV